MHLSLLRLLEEGAFEEDPEDPEFEEGADEASTKASPTTVDHVDPIFLNTTRRAIVSNNRSMHD